MNRRRFLESLAIGASALSLRADTAPTCAFPSDPRSRIAVASYPFRKDLSLKNGTMKLIDFPKMIVDRFNVHGIEPLDEHFASTDAAYLAQFREALTKVNAHVVNISVGRIHGNFDDPDEQKRKAAIESARKWVDVAEALGAPGIRVHLPGSKGKAQDAALAATSLRQVADYGQQKNIVINMENDDPQTEDAFFIVSIIEKAGTPWLRALPDFCNSMIVDKGEDFNYKAVTAMFQHACTISHAKEIETDNGKLFRIDMPKTFSIARAAGYKGYFSMEWDSDGDPYSGTQHLIDLTLKSLS